MIEVGDDHFSLNDVRLKNQDKILEQACYYDQEFVSRYFGELPIEVVQDQEFVSRYFRELPIEFYFFYHDKNFQKKRKEKLRNFFANSIIKLLVQKINHFAPPRISIDEFHEFLIIKALVSCQ